MQLYVWNAHERLEARIPWMIPRSRLCCGYRSIGPPGEGGGTKTRRTSQGLISCPETSGESEDPLNERASRSRTRPRCQCKAVQTDWEGNGMRHLSRE
eukprot:1135991-Amorphochlora_amoeboformis.AAC.2